MTTLPDLEIRGEDIARLLIVARDVSDDDDHADFAHLIASAFLAAVRNRLGLPTLSGWIQDERLAQLEEAGAFPFWKPPDEGG